jgi:hypothetical protein
MVKNIYEQIFKDLAFEKKSQQPSQNNLQPPNKNNTPQPPNKIEPPPQAWDEFGQPRDPAFIKPMQDYLRAAKAEHPEEYQKLVNAVNALYNLDPLLRFYYLNEPLPAHSTQIPLQIPYQMDEILDDRALIKRVID